MNRFSRRWRGRGKIPNTSLREAAPTASLPDATRTLSTSAQSPIPNPQSPIPNPQSPIPNFARSTLTVSTSFFTVGKN